MKKLLLLFCVLILTSCGLYKPEEAETEPIGISRTALQEYDGSAPIIPPEEEYFEENPLIGNNAPVSRALAAKMLVLINNDFNDISNTEREISFSDTDVLKWYDKFINTAFIQSIMHGYGDDFLPGEALTLEHAQLLLDNMDENNKVKLKLTEENRNNAVSYALWIEMYKKFLENYADGKSVYEAFQIAEKDIVVLATPGNNSQLNGFNLISDTGPMTYNGLYMDDYIDKQIRVLVKDNEIIAVLSVVSAKPRILNCYIVNAEDNSVTIFTGGAERRYEYKSPGTNLTGKICDITIDGNTAEDITVYGDLIKDRVMRFDDKVFEFMNNGILEEAEDFKVYSETSGAVKWKSARELTAGADIARYIIKDSKVCTAVIEKKTVPETIRVAINASGFSSLYHDEVRLTADTDYTVKYNGAELKYKKGEELCINNASNGDLFGANRLYISTDKPDGKIEILSVKRNWPGEENPKYRGIIEIGQDNGKYTLVNEVSMEEYLYAVVPSEMPTSHGVEAAKVQAVTARSYAYNQYYANRYHKYGGNVDDSVSCQVYNNIPENEVSIAAVDGTFGQCLLYLGNVVSANFFSTSAGFTANSGEVWQSSTTKQFPTATESYLKAVKQYKGADFGDLSIESNAERFFKATDIESYDRGFAWFRWAATVNAEEITKSINEKIKARYEANPRLIKTLQPNGLFLSRPIETVGEVLDISVTKRGEGGNVMEIKITGSKATVLVITEYNVRALIRPAAVNRSDGSIVENFGLMPSAFFIVDKDFNEEGALTSVTFYGGGYGHGVGMSQNGVKGMIDLGFTFDEILNHYYNGCIIQKMY